MYTEEPKRYIDWGNIFKKVFIIVIVIALMFLIFWLLIRNNGNKITVNNDKDANNSSINESFYSNDFISNYRYFHDTAKEYFLISELPENGKTVKYTLKELINKGLILAFGYENKACDLEASYVLVTNVNGTYKFTTTLVCGTEVAKTTEELGCNQLCPGGNCTVSPENPSNPSKPSNPSNPSTPDDEYITEYEHQKEYTEETTEYSCPKDYTKVGEGENTQCIKKGSTSIDATKVTNYSCPDGYTQSGKDENTKCTKKGSKSVNAKVTVTYTCDNGYAPVENNGKTKCYKKTDVTMAAKYTDIPVCDYGYTLTTVGYQTTCVKSSTYTYTPIERVVWEGCPSGYSPVYNGNNTYCKATTSNLSKCPNGYEKVGTGANTTCRKITAATPKCPNGYSVSGSGSNLTCIYNNSQSYLTKTTKYYCGSTEVSSSTQCKYYRTKDERIPLPDDYGYTYHGCTRQTSYPTPCNTSSCTGTVYYYYCPAKTSYYYDKPTSKTTYSCPTTSGWSSSGSGSNMKCTYSNKNYLTYECSTGDKSGTSCLIDNSNLLEYYCPAGYTPSGSGKNTTCTKTAIYEIEFEDYCPTGVLVNNTCVVSQTDVKVPTYLRNYYCSEVGYTLSNTTCYKTTEEYKDNAKIKETYSCTEGTLKDKKCIITTTENAKPIVDTQYTCPKGYTRYGTICSKGTVETTDVIKTTKKVTKYSYIWSPKSYIEGWTRTGNTRKVKTSSK